MKGVIRARKTSFVTSVPQHSTLNGSWNITLSLRSGHKCVLFCYLFSWYKRRLISHYRLVHWDSHLWKRKKIDLWPHLLILSIKKRNLWIVPSVQKLSHPRTFLDYTLGIHTQIKIKCSSASFAPMSLWWKIVWEFTNALTQVRNHSSVICVTKDSPFHIKWKVTC